MKLLILMSLLLGSLASNAAVCTFSPEIVNCDGSAQLQTDGNISITNTADFDSCLSRA